MSAVDWHDHTLKGVASKHCSDAAAFTLRHGEAVAVIAVTAVIDSLEARV